MSSRHVGSIVVLITVTAGLFSGPCAGATAESDAPAKVYVPYDELKDVFEAEDQGVFLSYKEFQRLWRAAQGKPAGADEAPFDYLLSTARFNGTVADELGSLQLELTVDILTDEWVDVPIGLGGVAISAVRFVEPVDAKPSPLLRVVKGRYILTTRGKGRYVLAVDFVSQLETKPGLNVLRFKLPSAAITTLELVIPEENMKVDVKPMLAATTTRITVDGTKSTKLQAFLGSAKDVNLSWKPRTQAAAELDPVVVCTQFQHIDIAEALITYDIKLDYSIHRGGADAFAVRLPSGFRVTQVTGANISKWDVKTADAASPGERGQTLQVALFTAAKNSYSLQVKMERFLQEADAVVPLEPVVTQGVLRRSGLVGITHSQRRLVQLKDLKNLARVDIGRLPKALANRARVTAYRFITSDYGATISIETAKPRVSVNQRWMLGADSDKLYLQARINYRIERTGVFQLEMDFPEPWKISQVAPAGIVDDHQLKGAGDSRKLSILLKKEQTGSFDIDISAERNRADAQAEIDFRLPLAGAEHVQLYQGQLILLLAEQLRAEIGELGQLSPISLNQTKLWTQMKGLSPAMAFEFKAVDRQKPAGARFRIAVKPAQVSATVDRLVDIQPGSIAQEARINYQVRYAPVDTFYVKMPVSLTESRVDITGANIKEKPRIDALPADQVMPDADAGAEADKTEWAYYKIVLQSKVSGHYTLRVRVRSGSNLAKEGQRADIVVPPILAAGKLSDQNGRIAVAKGATLAIGEPVSVGLIPADPGSEVDLPFKPHRDKAVLAFKHHGPSFALTLPVVVQKEATVFTTIVDGAIIEQILARDGMCRTHATYVLATSQGDRLSITLPQGAELTAVLLNGAEAQVERGMNADERIVRLPPSAGQVSRFVLEVAYGLKGAKASRLKAPALSPDIPVQQTLWRLWIPQDYLVLGHDRVFSMAQPWQRNNLINRLGRKQSVAIDFKLSGQGKPVDFLRQGFSDKLSVCAARKGVFCVLVWLVIAAAGAAMLKLSGLLRIVIVLAVILLGGIAELWQPLFVTNLMSTGCFAAVLVLVLWVGQWGLVKIPKLRTRLIERKQLAAETAAEEAPPQASDANRNQEDKE